MKKLLIFIPSLSGGGAERVIANLILNNKVGIEIVLVVLTSNGKLTKLVSDKVKLIDLKCGRTLFSFFKLIKLLVIEKPDVVFSSLLRTHVPLTFASKMFSSSSKIVLRSPNTPKWYMEGDTINPIFKKLITISYNMCDLVIAQTPQMRSELVEFHNIDNNKVVDFANPINIDYIDKCSKVESPLSENYINFVASGRLSYQKGFDCLIKSFKLAQRKLPNSRLYILGDDHENLMPSYLSLIEGYGLMDKVFFVGFVENPYVYYVNCDAYILSSRWEGLPNTVLECLYLKKRVITTNCIDYMETIINNGDNGLIVDVDNVEALADAMINYKRIENLGSISLKNTLSIEKIIELNVQNNEITS